MSVARTCLPLPALTIALSQVGVWGVLGRVEASARRISSLHSDGVRMLSITAAKWSLYFGRAGLVFVKSIL